MATRFEIVLHGDDAVALRAAGEEALDEIERLHAMLSLYEPTSEVARINALAAREAVRISPELFRLLERAQHLSAETEGAFDITVAPLMRCWGFVGSSGQMPSPEDLADAQARVGMQFVELNSGDFTVRFARDGMMLDFGAIGKGYAVERAAELLREAGMSSALIHGGTSTVHGLGTPEGASGWKVAIEQPAVPPHTITESKSAALLAVVELKDEAMSISGVSGKFFQYEGRTYGHVIDPRTGYPTSEALLAAVVLPSATDTDALSTALLTAGASGHNQFHKLRSGIRTLVVSPGAGGLCVESKGIATYAPKPS